MPRSGTPPRGHRPDADPALSATDQRSQVQLYREGPNDKVFMFLEVEKFATDVKLPKTRLVNIDPYDQPAVQDYTYALMGKKGYEAQAKRLKSEKSTLAFRV